jgi:hypothetical protein
VIVVELLWATVCAVFVYLIIQSAIRMVSNYLTEKKRREIDEAETKPLREEPPYGTPGD